MYSKVLLVMAFILPQETFKEYQLSHARVKDAYVEKEAHVRGYFADKKLQYVGYNLFIRAFKQDGQLEVWIKSQGSDAYSLLHVYDICATSGSLGPKRRQGDFQVPEGVYSINHFNPSSNFLLSLGINYPNASDKLLSDKKKPGGEIYIHGDCVTVGCIPLTDDKIRELYILAVEARNGGQSEIPVHIFPTRMNSSRLKAISNSFPAHRAFWNNLKVVYDDFELRHQLRKVKTNADGTYHF